MIDGGWCAPGLSGRTLDAVTWVNVDTETSGLDPAADELRELAALVVDPSGRQLDTITWRVADGAGDAADAIGRIVGWLDGGGVLVAHNLSFDLSFLARSVAWRAPRSWLCTMRLCGGRVSLAALAARLDVKAQGRHTALGDAATLARVVQALVDRARTRRVATVAGLAVVCPVVVGDRPPPETRVSWDGVRAVMDIVAPIPFIGRDARQTFRAVVDGLSARELGPSDPGEHSRVVAALAEAGVTALSLDVLLAELREQIPAKCEIMQADT